MCVLNGLGVFTYKPIAILYTLAGIFSLQSQESDDKVSQTRRGFKSFGHKSGEVDVLAGGSGHFGVEPYSKTSEASLTRNEPFHPCWK